MTKKLGLVTCYYYDAFMTQSADSFLAEKKIGSGVRVGDKLVVKTSSGNVKLDLSSIKPEVFLSSTNLADAQEDIVARLNIYNHLAKVKDFTVKLLSPGQVVTVPLEDEIGSFVLTKKTLDYFDYVLYKNDKQKFVTATYSKKNVKGFTHSGDIGALLHYITCNGREIMENDTFVLATVGYNKKFLRTFKEQVPMICLVNYDSNSIYIVPCPLDQATIGDATLSGLVVGKRVGNSIKYVVLPSPLTVDNVNTGDLSKNTKVAFETALTLAAALFNEEEEGQGQEEEEEAQEMPSKAPSKEDTTLSEGMVSIPTTCLNMIENGISPFSRDFMKSTCIKFGSSISIGPFDSPAPQDIVNLSPLGISSGPAALALGTPSSAILSWSQYHSLFENKVPIIHISEKWSDQVKQACPTLLNGIFIVYTTKQASSEDLEDINSREKIFNQINISGVSALAGPCSLVLICINGRTFYYRGMAWPKILELVPKFGSEVTSSFSQDSFLEMCNPDKSTSYQTPWDAFVPRKGSTVIWQGRKCSLDDVAHLITQMNMEELTSSLPNVTDLLQQIQVLLDPEALDKFTKQLEETLRSFTNLQLASITTPLFSYLDNGGSSSDQTFKDLLIKMKAEKKRLNRFLRPVVDALGNLVSVYGATSRSHDLKRMERKRTIASNVGKAAAMTMTEKMDLIESACSEVGVAIADVDTNSLREACTVIGNGTFVQWAQEEKASAILSPSHSLTLDGTTFAVMLELTQTQTQHPLYGDKSCVALPQGHTGPKAEKTSIPWLLLDSHIQAISPNLDWIVECNRREVALFRILLRGTIANSVSGRSCSISPASKDLSYFLIHGLLCTMEGIVKGMSAIPGWEDSTAKVMRGLFGQLFSIMASGTQPVSLAWQLIKETQIQVPKPTEWWIYTRTAACFPYTAWPTDLLKKNIHSLLARAVRKYMIDPITLPMRNQVGAAEVKKSQDFRLEMDKKLYAVHIFTEILLFHRKKFQENSVEIATRLLEIMNPLSSRMNHDHFLQFLHSVLDGNLLEWDSLFVMESVVNTYTKRSACFQEAKQKVWDAVNDNLDPKAALKELMDVKEKIAAAACLPVDHIRMQNSSCFSHSTVGYINGDAELTRVPWSVTGAQDPLFEQKLNHVLYGGNMALDSSAVVTETKKQIILSRVEQFVSNNPKNEKALAFAKALPNMDTKVALQKAAGLSEQQLNLFHPFIETPCNFTEIVRKQSELFLEAWKDPTKVEEKAAALFMN